MRTLYLFPIQFPYTRFGECFLEEELKYTSKYFDKVVIVPLRKEVPQCKPVPQNCVVVEPLMENKFKLFFKCLYNHSVIRKLLPEFFKKKVYKDKAKFSIWLKGLVESNAIMNSKSVRRIGASMQPHDVCYFYWGKWSNILAAFWNGRCHLISRFHGFGDLWEDTYHEYFPLRKEVLAALDKAVFISQRGEKYFEQKYPMCNGMYSPLGSIDVGVPEKKKDGVLRIVSCSTIIPIKRVDLIFKALNMIEEFKVEWTHIGGAIVGDDSLYEALESEIAANKKEHLQVKLIGSLSHEKVMQYYAENPFDIFVNMSTIEGVPVSIMEALSCDIAIVATNVGGTGEVVTPETGVLVSSNPTPQEVADAVRKCVKANFAPRKFWEEHFDAKKNYKIFAEFLSSIQ